MQDGRHDRNDLPNMPSCYALRAMYTRTQQTKLHVPHNQVHILISLAIQVTKRQRNTQQTPGCFSSVQQMLLGMAYKPVRICRHKKIARLHFYIFNYAD